MSPRPRLAVQDLYRSYHAILGIYLTNSCNLQCRHCGTNSGPGAQPSLTVDGTFTAALARTIREGGIRMLHVSGGEPFLRRRELEALSSVAVAEGVPIAVNTNGSWATSVDRGVRLLRRLPGVEQVIISTDSYHAEWLPIDRVIHAALAAMECDRLVDIYTVTPFARRDRFVEDLDARLQSTGVLGRVRRFTVPLGPTGREEPIPEDDLSPWQSAPQEGNCNLLNRPIIHDNATVLACCNTPGVEKSPGTPLDLGRIGEAPLSELLARAADDPLLRAVRVLGPAGLLELLGEDGRSVLRERYRLGDMCTLCIDMMKRPEIVALLRERLAEATISRIVDAAFGLQCGRWPARPGFGIEDDRRSQLPPPVGRIRERGLAANHN